MNRLRIALVAPPWFAVPPLEYGGIEWVVSLLADGLTARGHDVTLFASGGSRTDARLVSTFETPPSEALGDPAVEARAIVDAFARHREFDLIHDHTNLGLIAAAGIETPVVHTVHNGVVPGRADLYAQLAGHVHYIAISCDQRSIFPQLCNTTVIHNGIDCDRYPFAPGEGRHLLFVGRMNPDKGVIDAIEIARRTGRRLVILGKINEAEEREYFNAMVKPALAGADVEFIDHASHDVKVRAYQGACATLFPIHWREPFGLVMAESMACGTPVIAYRSGSVPEVVIHGKTGFVCDSLEEAVAAVDRADRLSRQDCRARVTAHFSAERMVARHEQLYERLVRPASTFVERRLPALLSAS
jgi:glycosyltransferase involved in cell wall biosynthesis